MTDRDVPNGNPYPPPLLVRTSAAAKGLFVLAVGYTLYFAAGLLIPIAIAVLLSVLFFPVVNNFARWRVPRSLTAMVIVTTMVVVTVLALFTLSGPAQDWLRDAPHSIRELKREMLQGSENLEDIQALAKEVDELTDVEERRDPGAPQPVVVEGPGILQEVVGGLPELVTTFAVVMFLTFFLLITGNSLLLKVTRCGRTFAERRQIVTIARRIQAELSRYLATVTIINAILGVTTSIVLYFLEVPNPILWGTMVAIFNFAPYVGALVSALVLTVVGLTSFATLGEALMVPGSFVVLTALEGQLITPAIVGRRMSISPMMVLLSVIVWGWLWGIAGALMAVPILASLRAVCEHYPPLQQFGSFLNNGVEPPAATRPKRRFCPSTPDRGMKSAQ